MKNRVRIPRQKGQELVALMLKVRARHEAEGEASPLKVLDWATINKVIDEAATLEARALELKREKLSVFQQRGKSNKEAVQVVRSIRDVLSGVHLSEKKKLGLWGFDVLDEQRIARQREEVQTTLATGR